MNRIKNMMHKAHGMRRALSIVRIAVTVVFLIVGLLNMPAAPKSESGDSAKTESGFAIEKSDAWKAAKEVVSARLKAPSTAQFCDMRDAAITQDDDTWTIEGYVDAQNSFGAMIRNRFTVEITFGVGYEYTVEKCDIQSR